MKAILVVDLPSCCTACPFFEFINGDDYDDCRTHCIVNLGHINEYGTEVRPKWCPLKPMPKKKELANYLPFDDYSQQTRFMDFVNGYNACLRR